MKITPDTEIHYISMDKKNIELNKGRIPPVDKDYIFLFDIDDTLYKLPEKMEREELEKWKSAYDHYKVGNPSALPFVSLFNKASSYEEAFKLYFNKNPYEVEKVKGFMEYSKYIKKDEELKSLLENFPYRKWCFTNGMKCRAEIILDCLGLTNCIEGVICMEDGYPGSCFMGKPEEKAYAFVEDLLAIKEKSKVYFFDDRIDNIETGTLMGWNSLLIKKDDNIKDVLNGLLLNLSEKLER